MAWLSLSPWIPQILSQLSGPASPHTTCVGSSPTMMLSLWSLSSLETWGVCTGPPGADLGLVPVTGLAGAGASGRAAASSREGRGGHHVCPSRRLVLVAPPRDAELCQQHSDRTGVSASPRNPLPEAPGPQQPGPASLIYRNVRRNMHTILLPSSSSESPGRSAGSAPLGTVVMVLPPGGGARPHSAVTGALPSQAWRRLRRGRGASQQLPLRSGRLPTCQTLVLAGLGHRRRSAGCSCVCLAPDPLPHAHGLLGFPSWGPPLLPGFFTGRYQC